MNRFERPFRWRCPSCEAPQHEPNAGTSAHCPCGVVIVHLSVLVATRPLPPLGAVELKRHDYEGGTITWYRP